MAGKGVKVLGSYLLSCLSENCSIVFTYKSRTRWAEAVRRILCIQLGVRQRLSLFLSRPVPSKRRLLLRNSTVSIMETRKSKRSRRPKVHVDGTVVDATGTNKTRNSRAEVRLSSSLLFTARTYSCIFTRRRRRRNVRAPTNTRRHLLRLPTCRR